MTGTEYDRLVVSGAATLAGVVDVILLPGFWPAKGDTFEVLTAAGGITDGGLAVAPGDVGTWLPHVGTDLLTAEYVPEPATLALLGLGALTLLHRRRRA